MAGALAVLSVTSACAADQLPAWDAKRKALLDIDDSVPPPQVPTPASGDTDWLGYNRTLDGNRYSALKKIDADNIDRLEEACRVRISGVGPLSAGNVLANGIMYVTAAQATVAIQPTTCDIVWKTIYNPDEGEIYNANRGVGYADGKVFRGTGDARLVAYDALTGRELWRTKVGNPKNGEYADAAPLVWDGKVFIGLAAGDLGIVGRVMAFDANTGKQLWSFNTVAQAGEFGHETWPGRSAEAGGGGTWSSYALDAATGELFIPVANPAPDFDPKARRGDNLFTNSVVALDARTGKRIWHYQTRPNDNHDYGVSPPAVLMDLDGRKVLAQGSKDGFVYLIDRTTHQLIWKTPVTTILNHTADASKKGVKVCPGAKGGIEYNSPAYDPDRGLLIAGAVDWCYTLFAEAYPPHKPGDPYMGGRMDRGDADGTGWVTALDARTGKVRWKHATPAPVIAAITPTASGLTFAGDAAGRLYVFRTEDGKLLREIQTEGALAGGIITYQIQDRQYVAVDSGNVSRSSWADVTGIPTVIVYRLPETAQESQTKLSALTPDASHGRRVFMLACAACHGPAGQGQSGPRLAGTKLNAEQTLEAIVTPKKPTMPKLYPSLLSAQDVADVAAYVRSLH